jgi:environmental stress-induced protein Ves
MRVVRVGDYRRMPWKNGGGVTVEMIVSPPGASLDDFDWRISMAHVGRSGPFSSFPGIDRSLAVIAGAGIALAFDGGSMVSLDRGCQPFAFPGDRPVHGVLVDGPIDDLNVMTHRRRCRHRVVRHACSAAMSLRRHGETSVFLPIGGAMAVVAGREDFTLAEKDALVLERSDPADITVSPSGDIDVFLVDICRS